MRKTYFATFLLGAKEAESPPLNAVIEVCRDWLLSPRSGVDLEALGAVPFDEDGQRFTDVGESARVRLIRINEADWRAFGFRFYHPDFEDDTAEWCSEICCSEKEGQTRIAITTLVGRLGTTLAPLPAAPSRPRLTKTLVEKFGARVERELLAEPRWLKASGFNDFYNHLTDPERRLPIVFCSAQLSSDKPLVDGIRITDQLVGLAPCLRLLEPVSLLQFDRKSRPRAELLGRLGAHLLARFWARTEPLASPPLASPQDWTVRPLGICDTSTSSSFWIRNQPGTRRKRAMGSD